VKLLSPDELEAALRDIGARRYHRLHPFHGLLHGGKCSKGQVQAWALNRYYYQAMIPIKDASLIARCEDSAVRREWRSRLVDHDGEHEGDGGIARWLKLTDGLNLDRDYVTSLRGLLPGTRFAVEAYVRFVREKTLLEAIASSLTEMFSPVIIGERMAGMLANYDFISRETMSYFDKRPPHQQLAVQRREQYGAVFPDLKPVIEILKIFRADRGKNDAAKRAVGAVEPAGHRDHPLLAAAAKQRCADAKVAIRVGLVVDEIVAVGVARRRCMAIRADGHRAVAVDDRKADELR